MEIKEVLSVIAGFLFIAGFLPYIRAILVGETRPTKSTWIVWTTLDCILFFGMLAEGYINGIIAAGAFGACIILLLSFKYGLPGWTKLDFWILLGAAIGIGLWVTFENPTLAIVTSSTVMMLGSIPLFVNTWKDPSIEDKLAWTIFWSASIIGCVSIKNWTLADASGPVVYLTIQSIMILLLFVAPRIRS